jgi:hypothetical protein
VESHCQSSQSILLVIGPSLEWFLVAVTCFIMLVSEYTSDCQKSLYMHAVVIRTLLDLSVTKNQWPQQNGGLCCCVNRITVL